jgi:hypothetical protein
VQFFLSFHIHLQNKLFRTKSSFFWLHSCIFKTCFCPCLNPLNRCPFHYRSFYHFHYQPLQSGSSHYLFTFSMEYRIRFLSYFRAFSFSWFWFWIKILYGLRFCVKLNLSLMRFDFYQLFEGFIFNSIQVGFSSPFYFDFCFSSFS